MKVLYSVLDNPEAMKKLDSSGISSSQVKAFLETYKLDIAKSPANFEFVSDKNSEYPVRYLKKSNKSQKTKSARSRQLKRIYGLITRKTKFSSVSIKQWGGVSLDAATMTALSQKLKIVEPTKSESERRELLSELVGQERTVLLKNSRRPRAYFIKHLSEEKKPEILSKKNTSRKQVSKKVHAR